MNYLQYSGDNNAINKGFLFLPHYIDKPSFKVLYTIEDMKQQTLF